MPFLELFLNYFQVFPRNSCFWEFSNNISGIPLGYVIAFSLAIFVNMMKSFLRKSFQLLDFSRSSFWRIHLFNLPMEHLRRFHQGFRQELEFHKKLVLGFHQDILLKFILELLLLFNQFFLLKFIQDFFRSFLQKIQQYFSSIINF